MLGALQFTAILTLDATPVQMSALTAAGVLPALLSGFVIGAWVDRLRRRPILIGADLIRTALLGSIPVVWYFDSLSMEQVYVVAFLHGLLTIFFGVAYRSYLPVLVSSRKLVEANSRLSATASVAEIGGFSLGGWIAQAFSAIVVTAVDSATFLVSGLFLFWIRRPEPSPAPSNSAPNFRREILEGLWAVIGNPALRAIGVSKVSLGLASGIIGSLIMLFGIETLGFGPGMLGMIFAIGGIFSVLDALSAGSLTHRFGLGKTLTAGFLIWGSRHISDSAGPRPAPAGGSVPGGRAVIRFRSHHIRSERDEPTPENHTVPYVGPRQLQHGGHLAGSAVGRCGSGWNPGGVGKDRVGVGCWFLSDGGWRGLAATHNSVENRRGS